MIATTLVAIASTAVLAVCVILVLHPDYEDGFVGRVGLALIGIASLARVLGLVAADHPLQFSSIALVLWCGLAVFLGRHLFRFLRWRKAGDHDWRAASRHAAPGKQ